MLKCPFCQSEILPLNDFEFACPVCQQLVGVVADGPAPRLVQSAPDGRLPWIRPYLKRH
jgi:hypothetical protein